MDHAAPAHRARGVNVDRAHADAVDATLAALADPTRRALVRALMQGPQRAGELAAHVAMSAPALSRHLRSLRRVGLIVADGVAHDARVRVYRLAPAAFAPLQGWLAEIEGLWTDQLQAFKAHAERADAAAEPPSR